MITPLPIYADPVYTLQPLPGTGVILHAGDPYAAINSTGLFGDLVVTMAGGTATVTPPGSLYPIEFKAHRVNTDGSVTSGSGFAHTHYTQIFEIAWVDSNHFVVHGYWRSTTSDYGLRVDLFSIGADLTITLVDSSIVTPAVDAAYYSAYHPDLHEVLFVTRDYDTPSNSYTTLHVYRIPVTSSDVAAFPARANITMTASPNMNVTPSPLGAGTYLFMWASGIGGSPYYADVYDPAAGTVHQTTLDSFTLTTAGHSPYRPRNVVLDWYGADLKQITLNDDGTVGTTLTAANFLTPCQNYLDGLGLGGPGDLQPTAYIWDYSLTWSVTGQLVFSQEVYNVDVPTDDWADTPLQLIATDPFGTLKFDFFRPPFYSDTTDPRTLMFGALDSGPVVAVQDISGDPLLYDTPVEVLGPPTIVWGKVKPDTGVKVIKYTADGSHEPPDFVAGTPASDTVVGPSFSAGYLAPLAWDGGTQYIYIRQTGSQNPIMRLDTSGNSVALVTNTGIPDNFSSGLTRPLFVPFHMFNSPNMQIATLKIDDLTVHGIINLPNPTNASPSTTPVFISKAVPAGDAKIYIFTMTNTGSSGEVWSTDVDSSGNLSALTDLGPLTASSGGLAPHFNMNDLTMISDRLGISYNTKTLWDKANPLVIHSIAPIVPADTDIDPTYDVFDPYLGGASANVVGYPGHALLARKAADGSILKVVELEFAVDGTSCTITNSWTAPSGGAIRNMTYTKRASDASVIAVCTMTDSSGVPHIYVDLFGGSPSEVLMSLSDWSNGFYSVAPANNGFIFEAYGGTTHQWIVHDFGVPEIEAGPLYNTSITLLGPSTLDQGDSNKHKGKFAVDPQTNNVSGRFKVGTTDTDLWVRPKVTFFAITGDEVVGRGESTQPALKVNSAPQWREINIFLRAAPGATHYSVVAEMWLDDALTQPLAAGNRVYYDSFFVPESGYDLRDGKQPYLDGDQPFGIWEGTERNSTSIYGAKPMAPPVIVLDYDLPAYDGRTSTPTGPVDPGSDTSGTPPLDNPVDPTPPATQPDLP